MIARRRIALVSLVAALAAPGAGRASVIKPLPPRQRSALLVGVEDRGARRPTVPTLKRLAALLRDRYGYAGANVRELYDDQATVAAIREAVIDVLKRTSDSDGLLLLLALPRGPDNERGDATFLAHDASPANPGSVLTSADLLYVAGELRAQSALLVVPSCVGPAKGLTIEDCLHRFNPSQISSRFASGVTYVFYCPAAPESGPGGSSDLFDRLLAGLESSTGTHPVSVEEALGKGLTGDLRVMTCPPNAPAFTFSAETRRVGPSLRALSDARTPEESFAAIAALVEVVRTEPDDTRPPSLADAGRALMRLVKSGDTPEPVRIRAASALGELRYGPPLVEFLAAVLASDPSSAVRRAVVETMVAIGGEPAVSKVRAALGDPAVEVQVAAIRGLGRLNDVGSADAVTARLAAEPEEVRVAALQTLALLAPQPPELERSVRGALRDPAPGVRREAVVTMGQIGAGLANPETLRMLRSDDAPAVREAIAYGLGRQNVSPALEPAVEDALVEVLSSDRRSQKQKQVRAAAAWALGRRNARRAEGKLKTMAVDVREVPEVRRAVIEALGQMGSPSVVETLGRLLMEDRDASIRSAAANALGAAADPQAPSHLVAAMSVETDPSVRKDIETALFSVKVSASAGDLERRLHDPSSSVRLDAARRLGTARDPASVSLLIDALGDADYEVRRAAMRSLAGYADDTSAKAVADVAASPESELTRRIGAIGVVGLAPSAPGVDAVLAAAEDRSPNIRSEALRSLGAIAGQEVDLRTRARVESKIVQKSSDDDASVRLAAAEALAQVRNAYADVALRRLIQDPAWGVQRQARDSVVMRRN